MARSSTKFTVTQAVRRGYATRSRIDYMIRTGRLNAKKSGHNVIVDGFALENVFGDPDLTGEDPPLLGMTDLASRWGYSKQGVHQRMKRDPGFPQPVAKINNCKTLVFQISDIRDYEALHAELLGSDEEKRDHQTRSYRLSLILNRRY